MFVEYLALLLVRAHNKLYLCLGDGIDEWRDNLVKTVEDGGCIQDNKFMKPLRVVILKDGERSLGRPHRWVVKERIATEVHNNDRLSIGRWLWGWKCHHTLAASDAPFQVINKVDEIWINCVPLIFQPRCQHENGPTSTITTRRDSNLSSVPRMADVFLPLGESRNPE
eukprot:scaffold121408_cov30-Tisochrysis_lutea.AAC.18